jgi:hypothetical protein
MNKQGIVMAINARVASFGTPNSTWTIGVTHNPSERQRYWKDIEKKDIGCWTEWKADSLAEAQEVESYFINGKGLSGGPGVDLYTNKPVFVYIF